jgi:hypothetical protein
VYEEQFPAYEGPPVDTSPRPFGEIPGLWVKVTQMTEAFFAEEAPRASGSNVLISLLILAVITTIFSVISSLAGGGILAALAPPEVRQELTVGIGQNVLSSICSGIIGTLVGFYISNGLVYIGARIFGGSGDYGTQAYLQSLFFVPIGIISAVVSLVYAIPVAGPCIGIVVGLALSIYGFVLSVRVVKVVHNLATGQAVAAILVPVLVIIVGVACLLIVILALLGPAIAEVFEDILSNLQYQ